MTLVLWQIDHGCQSHLAKCIDSFNLSLMDASASHATCIANGFLVLRLLACDCGLVGSSMTLLIGLQLLVFTEVVCAILQFRVWSNFPFYLFTAQMRMLILSMNELCVG